MPQVGGRTFNRNVYITMQLYRWAEQDKLADQAKRPIGVAPGNTIGLKTILLLKGL